MGIANSLAALDAGANRIDVSAAGVGAGAGNTPREVLVAVLDRMQAGHCINLCKIIGVTEDRVVPVMEQSIRIDRDALTLGGRGCLLFISAFHPTGGKSLSRPCKRYSC